METRCTYVVLIVKKICEQLFVNFQRNINIGAKTLVIIPVPSKIDNIYFHETIESNEKIIVIAGILCAGKCKS